RIPAEVKAEVETKMEALKSASKGGDTAALRKAMDEFNESLQKVGQHIYQGAGAGGPDGQAPGGQEKAKEDVGDADYREVNGEAWSEEAGSRPPGGALPLQPPTASPAAGTRS